MNPFLLLQSSWEFYYNIYRTAIYVDLPISSSITWPSPLCAHLHSKRTHKSSTVNTRREIPCQCEGPKNKAHIQCLCGVEKHWPHTSAFNLCGLITVLPKRKEERSSTLKNHLSRLIDIARERLFARAPAFYNDEEINIAREQHTHIAALYWIARERNNTSRLYNYEFFSAITSLTGVI